MSALTVVLLDLDGTLIDAHDAIVEGVLELAAEAALPAPDPAWVRGFIGQPPESVWRALGARDPDAMVARFGERVLPRLPHRTRVLDGVVEGLAGLRALGLRLAVATTRLTHSALQTLEATGLAESFAQVSGRDLVALAKPAPDVLWHALEALGAEPSQALMIGDSDADVIAAHAAGVPCWAVLTGVCDEDTLRSAGADHILDQGLAQASALLRQGALPVGNVRT